MIETNNTVQTRKHREKELHFTNFS